MIHLIKTLWQDAEEILAPAQEEIAAMQRFSADLEQPKLITHSNKAYVIGWEGRDILVIDTDLGKPILRFSGRYDG